MSEVYQRKHGLATEQFTVTAFVGSSKNIKDLKGVKAERTQQLPGKKGQRRCLAYRGTSLTSKHPPLGYYRRTLPQGPWGGPRGVSVLSWAMHPSQGRQADTSSATNVLSGRADPTVKSNCFNNIQRTEKKITLKEKQATLTTMNENCRSLWLQRLDSVSATWLDLHFLRLFSSVPWKT